MSKANIFTFLFGIGLVSIGVTLSLTIIGAIIGLPLIMIGLGMMVTKVE
jgi:hypothetical protein